MVVLALLPLAFNLFDLLYALPRWEQSLTPLGFALSGIGLGGVLLRHRELDRLPIARQAVFDHLSEGVIILDHQLRVVDLNRAPLSACSTWRTRPGWAKARQPCSPFGMPG